MNTNMVMNIGKMIVFFAFVMTVVIFGGCGKNGETGTREYSITTIKDAIEIKQSFEGQEETSKAVPMRFLVEEKDGYDPKEKLNWSIDKCVVQGEKAYALKLYYEDESQYCEKGQVLSISDDSQIQEIILEKPDVMWMNEFCVGGKYIYWVEYHFKKAETLITSSVEYRIIQYNLETRQEKELGVRDGACYDEICLEANENYVTWYDSCWDSDGKTVTHSISVYDVKNEMFLEWNQDESVIKYMPYERLSICDGGITYFSEDSDGNVIINRVELETGCLSKLCIGKKSEYSKIAGCFSTQRYLGWFLDYGKGYYYVYDLKKGKLFKIDGEGIFSKYCVGDKFYANYANDEPSIRCYSLENESVSCYSLQGYRGFQFQKIDDGIIGLEIKDQTKYGMAYLE